MKTLLLFLALFQPQPDLSEKIVRLFERNQHRTKIAQTVGMQVIFDTAYIWDIGYNSVTHEVSLATGNHYPQKIDVYKLTPAQNVRLSRIYKVKLMKLSAQQRDRQKVILNELDRL